MKPVMVDLFCKAGGASRGYADAGFEVIGVDIEPQPNYPYEFHQLDAIALLERVTKGEWSGVFAGATAVHASPPCQAYANVTAWRGTPSDHPDLLQPTLDLLDTIGLPYIVENVPEARPTWDYILCGSQFGLKVKRHRGFKRGHWAGYSLLPPCDHRRLLPFMHKQERAYADAMGCTWMTRDEARQAIPPAYTFYLGSQLLEAMEVAA